MRVLELFCGIGGVAAAVDGIGSIVAAVDINEVALGVYRRNYAHPTFARELETVRADFLREFNADVWWLSPPCQPYTHRGKQRDVDDPRARSLLTVMDRIVECQPRRVALENVPAFATSRACQRLRGALIGHGYSVTELLVCPTQLRIPMRRPRYFLLARRDRETILRRCRDDDGPRRFLQSYIDAKMDADPQLLLDAAIAVKYAGAIHIVDRDDPGAVCNCFTSAYGRSHVRSGSYLRMANAVRRFAPKEILRFMGFPPTFSLPKGMSHRKAWELIGNSVSVDAVRHVLPTLADTR